MPGDSKMKALLQDKTKDIPEDQKFLQAWD